MELSSSIAELLQLDRPGLPLRADVPEHLRNEEITEEAAERGARVLGMLSTELTTDAAPWYPHAGGVDAAAKQFATTRHALRSIASMLRLTGGVNCSALPSGSATSPRRW